jgi:hypothetical protein
MSSQAHLSKSAPLPGPGHQARYPASYPGTTAWRCRPECPWFPVDFRPSTPCFRPASMVPSSTRPAFALWTSCSRQKNSVFLTVDLPSRSQTARTLPGFPCSARMRYDRGGRLLYSGAVVSFPASDGSLAGTCRFTAASPVIHLTHPIGGSHDYEASGDSPTFTRPVFPSPAVAGWNGNGFGFHPGLRTPWLPTTHATAGTVPWTLDRVMSSTIEPPNNMTTHSVRPHVAPHRWW